HRQARPLADSAAVIPQSRGTAEAVRRCPALRRDRDQCQRRHRDGRGGSVSNHPAPAGPVFTPERRAELDAMAAKYPTRQALLLPALWMAQHAHGWVSPEAIDEVA